MPSPGARAVDVAAGVLAALCVLAFDPSGWFAFAPAKWLVVTTGSAVVATLATWTRSWRLPPRRVSVLLGAFVGWMAVAAALGADPRYAWLGTPERHSGWLLWFVCALLLASGARLAAVGDGLIAAGVVMLPALVADALGHPVVSSGTERLTGTLGSAAYLGAACTLVAPVATGVALDRGRPRPVRAGAALAAGSGAFGLAGSGTRGAWVAAAVVGGALAWRSRRDPRLPLVALAAAAIVAVVALVAPLGSRASTALDRSAAGGASRLDEWRVATRTAAGHLLTGAGPEGYRVVFHEGVDARYERAHGRDPLPDRAHNGVLDIALAGGVPAAALHLAVLATIARHLYRRRAALGATGTGAAAALCAYLAQQQFLFPLAELEPVAALLAGGLLGHVGEPGRAPPGAVPRADAGALRRAAASRHLRPSRVWPGPVAAALVAITAAAACVSAWSGWRDVAADRAALRAARASGRGDQATAAAHARDAVAWRSDEVRLHLLLASVTVDPAEASRHVHAALEWSPGDPIALHRRAELLVAIDPPAAVAELRRLTGVDPLNAQLQLLYGKAAALTGDEVTAEAAWLVALDLAPDSPGPRHNLVALYRSQGRDAEADAMAGDEAGGNR